MYVATVQCCTVLYCIMKAKETGDAKSLRSESEFS